MVKRNSSYIIQNESIFKGTPLHRVRKLCDIKQQLQLIKGGCPSSLINNYDSSNLLVKSPNINFAVINSAGRRSS